MKFTAKPMTIDAIQYTGDNFLVVREFFKLPMIEDKIYKTIEIRIPDHEEPLDKFKMVMVKNGDWVFWAFENGTGLDLTTLSDPAFQYAYEVAE